MMELPPHRTLEATANTELVSLSLQTRVSATILFAIWVVVLLLQYVHVQEYMFVCVCTMQVCMHLCRCIYMFMFVCACITLCVIWVYICAYVCICVSLYSCIVIVYMSVYMYMCMYRSLHMLSPLYVCKIYVHMCIYV